MQHWWNWTLLLWRARMVAKRTILRLTLITDFSTDISANSHQAMDTMTEPCVVRVGAQGTSKCSREPQSMRETIKRTKLSLCEFNKSSARARMFEQRLRFLTAAMDVRERLGDPIGRDEIPEDLYKIIYNPSQHI